MTGPRVRVAMLAVALPMLPVAGCPTSSEGIDLATEATLTLVVSRVSLASTATASAVVVKSGTTALPQNKIALADDQILSVNNVALTGTTWTSVGVDATVASTVAAVEAPATYSIQFDAQGTITTCTVTPPKDFSAVTPAASTTVPRTGFTIAWTPSGESDVTVGITITGYVWSYTQSGTLQATQTSVSLADVPDTGTATVGTTQLSSFTVGSITATLTRQRTVSQSLGFSSGTVRLKIVREIPLTLAETVATTGS